MLRKKSVVFTAMIFAIVALFVATEGTATATGGWFKPECKDIIEPGEIVPEGHLGAYIYKFTITDFDWWSLSQLEFAFDSRLEVEGVEPVVVTLQEEGEGGYHPKNFGEDFPGRRIAIIDTSTIPEGGLIQLRVTGSAGNFGDVGAHTRFVKSWYKKSDTTCQVSGPISGSLQQQTEADPPECVSLDTKVSLLVTRGADACAEGEVLDAYPTPNCQGDPFPVFRADRPPDLLYSGPPGQNAQCVQESVDVESRNTPFYYYTYRSGGNVYELCFDLQTGGLVAVSGNCR